MNDNNFSSIILIKLDLSHLNTPNMCANFYCCISFYSVLLYYAYDTIKYIHRFNQIYLILLLKFFSLYIDLLNKI